MTTPTPSSLSNQPPYLLGRKCEGYANPRDQSHLRLEELKVMAMALGLSKSGAKQVICQRIRKHLSHLTSAEQRKLLLSLTTKATELKQTQTQMSCRFVVRSMESGVGVDVKAYQQFFTNSYVVDRRTTTDTNMVDLNFYMELPFEAFLDQARINLLMPNYEYLIYGPTRTTSLRLLRKIHYMICKTLITVDYCQQLKDTHHFTYQIVYVKHTTPVTPIQQMLSLPRDHTTWLHAAGKSPWKQTDTVLKAWVKHPEWPRLIVTCRTDCIKNPYLKGIPYTKAKNIELLEYVPDLNQLQYQILNHLCPSIVEGYGHYLNEARAYGCFIVTSDYPPMNELINANSGILVPCTQKVAKPKSPDVNLCIISTEDFEQAMNQALQIPTEKRLKMGQLAYRDYLWDTQFFIKKMEQTLATISSQSQLKKSTK